MRKIIAFISIILVATILSGCYPDGTVLPGQSTDEPDEPFEHHVQAQYGEITLDYMIPDEYPTEVPKIILTKKESWDREKLVSYYLGDEPYKLIAEPEDNPEPYRFIYQTEGRSSYHGKSMYIDIGCFDYSNNDRCRDEYMHGLIGSTYYNLRQYESDEQLIFPSEDAIKRANEQLEMLGITNCGDPLVIPVSKERADRVYEHDGGGMNYAKMPYGNNNPVEPAIPWTKEQEFYILIYQLEYNGIKVNDGSIRFNGMGGSVSSGMGATAYVDKDEVFAFSVSDIAEPEYETAGIAPINCSPKQASDALQEFLESRVNTTKQVIYKCCLEYVPFKRVDVNDRTNRQVIYVPAWVFYGYEEGETWVFDKQFCFLFYAETGVRYGSSF